MKIKTRLLCSLLGMSLLMALVGAIAVNRQKASAEMASIEEAENVAHALGLALISDSNQLDGSARSVVRRLHVAEGRDVVLVDIHKRVLADAVPASIGEIFIEDQHDEVASTIKDGKVRTFVEISGDNPLGIKQVVAPVQSESGGMLGAVILEYTPLYNELMQSTTTTIHQLVLIVSVGVAIAAAMAFYLGRSIAMPLEQLTIAATGFASGRTDLPMPPPRVDEIGRLANAFNDMIHKRRRAEEELRQLGDKLEVRVRERTAELARANVALLAENADRKRAEETSRESDEKFHQFAENSTDVFWMASPDLQQILYMSPAFEKIWGRSTESLYANPHQRVESILPEERERVFAVFVGLREGKSSVSVEYQIARPDGTTRWLHDRGFVVRDAAGNMIRLAGIASDITERKHS
jgi:PAS domain S-box-containing protein